MVNSALGDGQRYAREVQWAATAAAVQWSCCCVDHVLLRKRFLK